ncbi:MAG: cysteine hydrolase family protein [Eubacteriales bacterium]
MTTLKKAFILIDYVYDFVADDGNLTCGKPAQLIENYLVTQIKAFQDKEDFIVMATDYHCKDDLYNKEGTMFPAHCFDKAGQSLYGKVEDAIRSVPPSLTLQIHKNRYSAFYGTPLDLKLKERQVSEIHLAGVCTDICVLHTAIDAYNLGYNLVIHSKGVASFHEAGHTYALEHFQNVLGAKVI